MVVANGDLGVGAGHADGGHTRVPKGVGSGDGHTGAIGAQHHRAAGGNQSLGGGGRLVVSGLVIGIDQLHSIGLAADLHSGSQGVGVLHSQDFLLSAGAVVAGLGLKHTDLNHLVTGAGVGGGRSPSVGRTVVGGIVVSATAGQHGQQKGGGQGAGKDSFHVHYSFSFRDQAFYRLSAL